MIIDVTIIIQLFLMICLLCLINNKLFCIKNNSYTDFLIKETNRLLEKDFDMTFHHRREIDARIEDSARDLASCRAQLTDIRKQIDKLSEKQTRKEWSGIVDSPE